MAENTKADAANDAAVVATIDGATDDVEVIRSGALDVAGRISGLNTANVSMYSSITGDDFAAKLRVAEAMTSSEPLDDHLGKPINLVHFIVQKVELADDNGNVNDAPRCTLIADDGKAYTATSIGILTSLANLRGVLGEPEDWPQPIAVKAVKQKGNNGFSFFTLKFV